MMKVGIIALACLSVMVSAKKGLGETCKLDLQCNSGCCQYDHCIPSLLCSAKDEEEKKLPKLPCVQNWQCPSLLCDNGFCEQDFALNPITADTGAIGRTCSSDGQCFSGCCKEDICVPGAFCWEGPTEENAEATTSFEEVKSIVEEARDEVKLRSVELWGKCDYNFQCGSNCCKDKTCAFFSSHCND